MQTSLTQSTILLGVAGECEATSKQWVTVVENSPPLPPVLQTKTNQMFVLTYYMLLM